MPNLHPSVSPFAMPFAATHGTQVQNYHQTHVRSGVCPSRTYAYQGTARGHYDGQIPHHGGHPVNDTIVFPSHPVFPYSVCCQPSALSSLIRLHIKTATTDKPDILCQSPADSHAAQTSNQMITDWHSQTTRSLGVCTHQPNRQAATPPQQSPPRKVRMPLKYIQ